MNRRHQGIGGRRYDREGLRVPLPILVPLQGCGEGDQTVIGAMKEVWLTRRSFLAGP